MKEAPFQKAILEYLAYKRIFHWRTNSGAFKTESGGFYKMGMPGAPDITCIVHGRYVGLEVKPPKGKQNPNQIEFERRCKEAGGDYFVVTHIEDVQAALNQVEMELG